MKDTVRCLNRDVSEKFYGKNSDLHTAKRAKRTSSIHNGPRSTITVLRFQSDFLVSNIGFWCGVVRFLLWTPIMDHLSGFESVF